MYLLIWEWRKKLSNYNVAVIHSEGKVQGAARAPSRVPIPVHRLERDMGSGGTDVGGSRGKPSIKVSFQGNSCTKA